MVRLKGLFGQTGSMEDANIVPSALRISCAFKFAGYGKGMVINMEKKKQKTAIALEYNPEEEAPKIIATGKGRVAEKIIEAAQEADVPIHEDSKLADTLSKLEIGEMIPPELYEVVAEILVFVDAMDKIKAKMEKRGIL